jgi:hypothetical protein
MNRRLLGLPLSKAITGFRYRVRPPAAMAGVTNYRWTGVELLCYLVQA